MAQIIGFAGKKQSGKNTCCNFIVMLKLLEYSVCKNARLNKNGEIEVSDIFGETVPGKSWFLFKNPIVDTQAVLNGMNTVRIYALADGLKRIAIDVLGLPEDKVYGTDADKMTETHLCWENMPGVTTEVTPQDPVDKEVTGRLGKYYEKVLSGVVYHEPGPMTIREVLQFMGTEIFRRMYADVWIDSLIKRIEKDQPELALVCDVRFENEMKKLKKNNAIIIGLKRDIYQQSDNHASEKINFRLCHKTIKNESMTIPEQNKAVYTVLKDLGCKHLTDLGI